jgi:hypothetical protein
MTKENDNRYSMDGTYVVRLWDGFEHRWMDITRKGLSLPEAAKIWDEHTGGGKNHTKYEDMDYYDVFPDDTTMLYSYEAMDDAPSGKGF